MTYYLVLTQLLLAVLAVVMIWQAMTYFRNMWLWKKVRSMPLPQSYREALEKIPPYRLLPEELKEKIRPRLLFFARSKEFKGVGIEVTDEMKAVISFYACLMVVNIPDECYGELFTILVYPYDVVVKRIEAEDGIFREEELILEGLSAGDTVVVTWNEAKGEAFHIHQHNLILHEFAHVLDFENGAPDGVPPVERSQYHKWTQVLYRRYKELREKSRRRSDLEAYRFIGAYAATNEAEFFAVVTELFFQNPRGLKEHFPDLYDEFKTFYGLDTAELFKSLD
ncbi:M90 family metallopeptidase [Hydrogenimonas sp.]|uniref:M90 family metallopeptidase n=1 Tax=Hydrogenimonas sp. TaxID=2231112 RepID=UPI002604CADD|nr:M90 family metallopeptidase [Hydrogenimonas sp.]